MTCDRFSKSSSVVFFLHFFYHDFTIFPNLHFWAKKKNIEIDRIFFFPFLICLFYQVLYVFHTENFFPPVWHIFFFDRKSTLAFFPKKRKKHGKKKKTPSVDFRPKKKMCQTGGNFFSR